MPHSTFQRRSAKFDLLNLKLSTANTPAPNKMRSRGPSSNLLTRLRPLRSPSPGLSTSTITLTRPSQPLCTPQLFVRAVSHSIIRCLVTSRFQGLLAEAKIEEELVPGYCPDDFYPVQLGEVFNSRYQIIAKLGCGVGSTAWLYRDLRYHAPFSFIDITYLPSTYSANRYLTFKVCTVDRQSAVASQAENEAAISRYINDVGTEHPGIRYMRLMIDEFSIKGPCGTHRCLIFDPLGMTLTDLRNLTPKKALEKGHLQQSLQLVLLALDLLHQAGVVHTGMNLHVPIYTSSIA